MDGLENPSYGEGARNEEARAREAGFSRHVFLSKRRYADLGYLLPMFYIEPAVEPGVSALTLGWPAIYNLARRRKTDNAPNGWGGDFLNGFPNPSRAWTD
jgi:hypothetical protein